MADEVKNGRSEPDPLLRVRRLSKEYGQHRWLKKQKPVSALANIDLTLYPQSTLAVVGESGAGKSTLARCIARLEEPTSGEIWWEGENLLKLNSGEMTKVRMRIQMIFQDAAAAMNPRLTAQEIVTEPLRIRQKFSTRDRKLKAGELMEQVGLPAQWISKRPHEFSGGQRQRLTIARAIALQPKMLILDEALTGLDLSIQAQMVNLLLELQRSRALTYLLIAHDLGLVRHLADHVAVMREGKIVESGSREEIFNHPSDPYTRMLIDRFNSTRLEERG